MEEKVIVKFFIRPNGEMYEITYIELDNKTHKVKIQLDNNLSRWFDMDEIMIVPPVIRMKF
jgi:hypothetical protein